MNTQLLTIKHITTPKTDTNLLNIFYVNTQSMTDKLNEINIYLNQYKKHFFHIVVITET